MENNSLVKSSSAPLVINRLSWKKSLVQKLDLAAKATSYELGAGEPRQWEQVLEGCSIEEIEYGFLAYFRDGGDYFPKPGKIRELILIWRSDKRRRSQDQKTQEMLRANQAARESGKTVSLAEVQAKLKEIAATKGLPELSASRRMELKSRIAIIENSRKRSLPLVTTCPSTTSGAGQKSTANETRSEFGAGYAELIEKAGDTVPSSLVRPSSVSTTRASCGRGSPDE